MLSVECVECAITVHESLRFAAHDQCILQSMLDLLCHSFFIWHIMLLVNTLIVLHLTCFYSKIKIYWDWLLNVNCKFPVYTFSTMACILISSLLMRIFWPISIETILKKRFQYVIFPLTIFYRNNSNYTYQKYYHTQSSHCNKILLSTMQIHYKAHF